MMRPSESPLITAQQIATRVGVLASEIDKAYGGRELLLIPVLKGSTVFAADLMRRLTIPLHVDYVRARSYDGRSSRGTVSFPYLPEVPLAGRHVLIVEDILDTGRTTHAILGRFREERPASLALCVLLDKPARRLVPVTPDFVGFRVDDHFVIGYGLDFDERYRDLPDIHILEED